MTKSSGALGIETWVQEVVRPLYRVRDRKAIHDQVLGTHVFEPYEIAVLNTRLLQRLRYISQTGFVYLTFPGARHSRFEHTIGTVVLVERFAAALNCQSRCRPRVDGQDLRELRMAALLHDCGHAFFSHSSEIVYSRIPQLQELKNTPKLALKGEGEIVSYAIVTSDTFREFFSEVCAAYGVQMDLDRIADYIIGCPSSPERVYLAEIISGPFDVDKLDYIHRDAHATGLRLVVDLERFFYAISAVDIDGQIRLGIRAVEPLEQLIFSKMLLFATVYHHHKVKACDCLLRGAIDWARRNNSSVHGHAFENLSDFLRVTDIDFLSEYSNPLINRLSSRDLLYRAVSISRQTVAGWDSDEPPEGLLAFKQDTRDPARLAELNAKIYDGLPERVKSHVEPEEVWLDVPDRPKLKELALANIARFGGTISAERVFPTEGWLNAYGIFRSTGHVFAPREAVIPVFDSAQEVLRSMYGLEFNRDLNASICHW